MSKPSTSNSQQLRAPFAASPSILTTLGKRRLCGLSNPSELSVGDAWGAPQRGVFVDTFAFLALFTLFILAAALAKQINNEDSSPDRPWPPTFRASLESFGPPGVYILIAAFLLDSTVTAGVSFAIFSTVWYDHLIGVLMVAMSYGYVLHIFMVTYRAEMVTKALPTSPKRFERVITPARDDSGSAIPAGADLSVRSEYADFSSGSALTILKWRCSKLGDLDTNFAGGGLRQPPALHRPAINRLFCYLRHAGRGESRNTADDWYDDITDDDVFEFGADGHPLPKLYEPPLMEKSPSGDNVSLTLLSDADATFEDISSDTDRDFDLFDAFDASPGVEDPDFGFTSALLLLQWSQRTDDNSARLQAIFNFNRRFGSGRNREVSPVKCGGYSTSSGTSSNLLLMFSTTDESDECPEPLL